MNRVTTPYCDIDVPDHWDTAIGDGPLGPIVTAEGDWHILRVERALEGLVPASTLMAHVSVVSRQNLDGYEPAPEQPVLVFGAGPALGRIVATDEGPAGSFVQLEVVAEGYDGFMWYARVSAPRGRFDNDVAQAILDSLQIHFVPTSKG
jgi:hypothetical protein